MKQRGNDSSGNDDPTSPLDIQSRKRLMGQHIEATGKATACQNRIIKLEKQLAEEQKHHEELVLHKIASEEMLADDGRKIQAQRAMEPEAAEQYALAGLDQVTDPTLKAEAQRFQKDGAAAAAILAKVPETAQLLRGRIAGDLKKKPQGGTGGKEAEPG